jgi:hypothetical protein
VASHNWIGRLTPLHCTSSGKVLIAHLEPGRRAGLLAVSGMPALTPHTVTSTDRLDGELSTVRTSGYAVAVEEYELGLNAVAAPVRDDGAGGPTAGRHRGDQYEPRLPRALTGGHAVIAASGARDQGLRASPQWSSVTSSAPTSMLPGRQWATRTSPGGTISSPSKHCCSCSTLRRW